MSAPVPDPASDGPERLLAESDWVRRLARRLVDPDRADDLAQEALLRGLEEPPKAGWPLRSWLGGVVRNLARQERRAGSRRRTREAAAARPEPLPSTHDALVRLQEHETVVRAVLALDEPYRTTVVLRFYDQLAPRTIARRMEVPVSTVKTRLARALTQLRGRLDRTHGADGRSWALALLPLARFRPGIALPLHPGALMSIALKVGLPLAALVIYLAWPDSRVTEEVVGAETVPAPVVEPVLEPADRLERRVAAEASLPTGEPAQPEPDSPPIVTLEQARGRVIDADGQPVAGVPLGLRSANGSRIDGADETYGSAIWRDPIPTGEPLAVSGLDGTFLLEQEHLRYSRIVSQGTRWETVLAPQANPDVPATLVVAPARRLHGRVEDEDGMPVEGTDVAFGVPRDALYRAGVDLTATLSPGWMTTSDANGEFVLERMPDVAGGLLRASTSGYDPTTVDRDAWASEPLVLTLRRPSAPRIDGVVEADGRPVEDARVSLGSVSARSAADGTFTLYSKDMGRESELLALASGHQPARFHADADADGSVRWPSFVRLELGEEPLALEGMVLDAGGEPLADQKIWLANGTVLLEGQLPTLLEASLAGSPSYVHGATSDEAGRFRIDGLEPHDYSLRVVDPKSTLVTEFGPFEAGTLDLVLHQRTDEVWPELRGQVVARDGTPIVEAHVSLSRELDLVGAEGGIYFVQNASTPSVKVDDEGRFTLSRVPREGSTLNVYGAGLVDPELPLTPGLDPRDVRVVVDRWVKLSVDVSGPLREATGFTLLDDHGEALQLRWAVAGGQQRNWSCALDAGASTVVECVDRVVTLVLYHGDEELTRVPVHLVPGEINRIEL